MGDDPRKVIHRVLGYYTVTAVEALRNLDGWELWSYDYYLKQTVSGKTVAHLEMPEPQWTMMRNSVEEIARKQLDQWVRDLPACMKAFGVEHAEPIEAVVSPASI